MQSMLGHFSDEFLRDALIDIYESGLVIIIIAAQTRHFGRRFALNNGRPQAGMHTNMLPTFGHNDS
jgi:hypothetical protein